MLKLKTVNKAIKKLYPTLELFKGEGYFYFSGSDERIHGIDCTSVYVYRLNDLTLEQWMSEARNIHKKMSNVKHPSLEDFYEADPSVVSEVFDPENVGMLENYGNDVQQAIELDKEKRVWTVLDHGPENDNCERGDYEYCYVVPGYQNTRYSLHYVVTKEAWKEEDKDKTFVW